MFISTSFVLECVILISLFPYHPLSLLFCGLLSILTTSFLTFFSSSFFSHPPFLISSFPFLLIQSSILIFIPPCSHLLSHLSSPNFLPLITSFLTCTLLLVIPPFRSSLLPYPHLPSPHPFSPNPHHPPSHPCFL